MSPVCWNGTKVVQVCCIVKEYYGMVGLAQDCNNSSALAMELL